MNYEYHQTDLSRGILSGLFAGLIAAVANTVFALVYRGITSFYEFNGVDVTVIVFGSILQLITCGLLFSFLVHYRKNGVGFYRVIVTIVTILIVFLGIMVRQSVMGSVPYDFKFLVVGTQVIIGCLAIFLIPYLSSHDNLIS
ncbi:MAG: hypothetical protein JO072_11450 [Parafilimonas sp.]|nr:hypothetical protein [Parafilimonas sp.]